MNDVWYAWRGVEEERKMRDEQKGAESLMYIYIYFFLAAFSADFVTLPPPFSVFSTDLMTPTATVCLMSRTAKRPRGGYSEYDSTHIGLLGTSLTMQASPDLTNFGALMSINNRQLMLAGC
jgi:hypothetical protein